MTPSRSKLPTARLAFAGVCTAAALVFTCADAMAQGWGGWWPWSQPPEAQRPPPVPREPVYRGPGQYPPGQGQYPPGPGQYPPGAPGQYPGQGPGGGQGPGPGPGASPGGGAVPGPGGFRSTSAICLQLEQRLVAEGQFGMQGRDVLPRIENDMRQLERAYQTARIQLDRSDCWDMFLFSKTLRRTQRCIQLNAEAEGARQRLADLEAQRRQILGRGDRSYQDDIIRELARNGCGQQYQQEARRRYASRNPFASIFGGEESDAPRGGGNQFGQLPFATYRTLCVRLCDGYYFPVSFSTLPNHFQRDAEMCQSQCAAPAELYYHQNPGGAVDQMVSASAQQPYTSLKTAWRYRKEYVQGCSCKEAEYVPQQPTDRKAEAPAQTPVPKGPGATARVDQR
jgi:hypothetical protein